jgi:hypothetical protein
MATFKDFALKTVLDPEDLLVGYQPSGLSEFRIKLKDLANLLNSYATPTPTPTFTSTPTATPTNTPEPTPTATPTNTPEPTPTQWWQNGTPTPTPTEINNGTGNNIDIGGGFWGDPHYSLTIGASSKPDNPNLPVCGSKIKFATSESNGSGSKINLYELRSKKLEKFIIEFNESYEIVTRINEPAELINNQDFSAIDYVPNWIRHDKNAWIAEDSENLYIACKTSKIIDVENYRVAIFYQQESSLIDDKIDGECFGRKMFSFEQTETHIMWGVIIPKSSINKKYFCYAIGCYRIPSADGSVRKLMASWDDNSTIANSTKILLFYGKKGDDWVAVCITGKPWGGGPATLVDKIYVYGNVPEVGVYDPYSSQVNIQTLGFNLKASGYDVSFEISNNYDEVGGGLILALRKVIDTNAYFNGGSGSVCDGFGAAGASYGITRNDLVIPSNLTNPDLQFFRSHITTVSNLITIKDDENVYVEPGVFKSCSLLINIPNYVPPSVSKRWVEVARERFPWDGADTPLPDLPDGTKNPCDPYPC